MTNQTKTAKTPVTVGVDPAVIPRLDAVARRDLRSRAEIMRRAIDEFLTREEAPAQAPEGRPDAGAPAQRQRRTRR